jgi:hypothetical protein
MDTQEEKLKEQEEARDFFCIVNDLFRIFARRSSMLLGSAWAFTLAMIIILIWGLSGPTFHFSETWQLIIAMDHTSRDSNSTLDPAPY